jgi:type I restriction enzyme S subunit
MTYKNCQWSKTTIGQLGRVVTGKTPSSSKPDLFGNEYPFITPTDMAFDKVRVSTERFLSQSGRDSQASLLLPKSTVCFCCIGATIGKICMTARESFTNQQINSVIVDRTQHEPYFIYSLLRTLRSEIAATASGAATPILNKSSFSSIKVAIPPLATQRKIAGVLSAYDDLIENNSRRIAILEEMAQAIYREWFVNFRFPGHENVKLIDSPLGKIPEGWKTSKIGDVLDIRYGKNLPTKQLLKVGQYPVYGAGGIIGYYNSCVSKSRTSLITCRGNGSGTVWRTRESAFITNNSFYLSPLPPVSTWTYGFIELHLKHSNVSAAISGSAQPQITIDGLSQISICVPNKSLVTTFTPFVDKTNDLIDALVRKNRNLASTRDLLLPKLISGQLDVEDLDIDIGEQPVEATT